ncbi:MULTISPECIES: SMI1/KNR4 family protein [Catenuloplanes]|uniref:Uncharacterized protein n=1 Tax=Catenuloplanes niger TaxID=587534 RepID=A0AAE4CTF9_9ACTN|nr:hypothetical protein [Catenuloplanes niger]MDR7325256.1 hypothetical protein [Catenuloplanes niger]
MAAVFRDRPAQPAFYGTSGMTGETAYWHAESDPDTIAQYVGRADPKDPPGDIDPSKSILIGDLGPDQPIALDYRTGQERPPVVYLTTYGGWIQVAPDIESLLERLGLDE